MADVDSVRLQLNDVEMRQSSVRQTPLTSFGETMRSGMNGTMRAVSNVAGYSLPGAAVVGAAISQVGSVRDQGSANGSMVATTYGLNPGAGASGTAGLGSTGMTGTGAGTTGSGSYIDGVASQAQSGNPNAQMMMATQQMQEMNQQFNLQYLQLQEGMQAENRQFTALSNVMKTKNDTAKNSLSNLK